MNTDRDPYSQGQMAGAVAIYLNATHPLSTLDRNEADAELEQALLQQGVMTPDEAIESIERIACGVEIAFEHDERIILTTEGRVFPSII